MKPTRTLRVYQDNAGDWRWRVVAANGKTVADSGEGYTHRKDCIRMAIELYGGSVSYELPKLPDPEPEDAA